MKPDVRKKIEETLRKRTEELPPFIEEYIENLAFDRKEIRTQVEYTKDILLFLTYLREANRFPYKSNQEFQEKDMKKITIRDLRGFMMYLTSYEKTFLKANGKQVTQIFSNQDFGKARKIATLHEFFNYLLQEGIVEKNIAKRIEIKTEVKREIKTRLTKDEIDRFFESILHADATQAAQAKAYQDKNRLRDYTICTVLAYTGLRVSELIQLDLTDVSLEEGAIKVIRKGGKTEIIPLPPLVVDQLHTFLAERKEMDTPNPALFLSTQKKRINDKTVRLLIDKYATKAGLSIKVTPHTFRRTFGTRHYNQHGDMSLTAKVLGHSNPTTTQKFYADPSNERKVKSMQEFSYDAD